MFLNNKDFKPYLRFMLSLTTIHKWVTSVALLATLISFSGVASATTNFQKTQTELVSYGFVIDKTTVLYGKVLFNNSPKAPFNQYRVSNFKRILIVHNFDFSITFKSQKETVLKFNDFNTLLQQNLLAQIHSSELHKPSIE